ncbi:hypothetical protein SCUP234_10557 [Seiridium cupressi]
MRPALVLFSLVALVAPAQGKYPYCADLTQDKDWCWNGLIYGRCHDNKLVKSGECDYKAKKKCQQDPVSGTSCVDDDRS